MLHLSTIFESRAGSIPLKRGRKQPACPANCKIVVVLSFSFRALRLKRLDHRLDDLFQQWLFPALLIEVQRNINLFFPQGGKSRVCSGQRRDTMANRRSVVSPSISLSAIMAAWSAG
jgi:hypothetical protein